MTESIELAFMTLSAPREGADLATKKECTTEDRGSQVDVKLGAGELIERWTNRIVKTSP